MGACTSVHAIRRSSDGRVRGSTVAEPQGRRQLPTDHAVAEPQGRSQLLTDHALTERSHSRLAHSAKKQCAKKDSLELDSFNSQSHSQHEYDELSPGAQALEDRRRPRSRLEYTSSQLQAGAGLDAPVSLEHKSEHVPLILLDACSPAAGRNIRRMSYICGETIQVFSHGSLCAPGGRRHSMWQRYKLRRKHKTRRRSDTADSPSKTQARPNATTMKRRFSRRFTFSSRLSATSATASASRLSNASAGEKHEQHEQLLKDYLSVSMCAGGSFADIQDEQQEAGGGKPEELSLFYERQRRWHAAAEQLRSLREERKAKLRVANLASYPELRVSARPREGEDGEEDDDEHSRPSLSKKRRSLTPPTDLSKCSHSCESGNSNSERGSSKPASPAPGAQDLVERQNEHHHFDLPDSTLPCASPPRAGSPAKKRLSISGSSRPLALQSRARHSGPDAPVRRPVPLQSPHIQRARASSLESLPVPLALHQKPNPESMSFARLPKRVIIDSAPRVVPSNANEPLTNSNDNKPPLPLTLKAADVPMFVSPSQKRESAAPSCEREFMAPNPVQSSRKRLMRGRLAHQAQLEKEKFDQTKCYPFDKRASGTHADAQHKGQSLRKLSAPSMVAASTAPSVSPRSSSMRNSHQLSLYYSHHASAKELPFRRIHGDQQALPMSARKSSPTNPMSPPSKPSPSYAQSRGHRRPHSSSRSLSASASMLNTSGDSLYFHPRMMQERPSIEVPQFSLSPERIARARQIPASSPSVPKP